MSAPSICAGCGKPIDEQPFLTLADDALVHFADGDKYRCLIAYGQLRRACGIPPEVVDLPRMQHTALVDISAKRRAGGARKAGAR